jgi:hypothetical protein
MSDSLLPSPLPATELSAPAKQFLPIFDHEVHQEMREILEANLGPRGLTPQQLDRIKVPSGGAQMFNLQGIEGEEAFREVSGIVLAWGDIRMYYKVPFAERGKQRTPPDCLSKDGLYGIGDPGGECRHCPMAGWESDPKGGRGQACKEIRRILLLRGDHLLPELVNVPPTSLRNAQQYFLRLASRRIPYWSLITTLRLEKASNADGIDYARITFTSGDRFNDDERAVLAAYQAQMTTLLREAEIDDGEESDKHDDDDE